MSPRDPVPAPQGRSSPSPPRPPPAESANQLPQGLSACQGCLGTFLKFPIGFTEVNNHFKKRQLANILDLCPVTDSLSSTSQDQMVTITRLFRAHLLRASREPKTCRNEGVKRARATAWAEPLQTTEKSPSDTDTRLWAPCRGDRRSGAQTRPQAGPAGQGAGRRSRWGRKGAGTTTHEGHLRPGP